MREMTYTTVGRPSALEQGVRRGTLTFARAQICVLAGLLALGFSSTRLGAQVPVGYGGCVDFRGAPVLTLENVYVPDVAMASIAQNGTPIIQYNPQVLVRFSPPMRRWWYMHECGHHALAHSVRNIPFAQEQEADCFAIRTLVQIGEFTEQHVNQVQFELSQLGSGDWQHLPGPHRAINIRACLATGE